MRARTVGRGMMRRWAGSGMRRHARRRPRGLDRVRRRGRTLNRLITVALDDLVALLRTHLPPLLL